MKFEGNGGGPINQRASFIFDGQRNMVDNGAIINAITLNPQTLAIQPYFSIYTVPQVLTRASPRIDYRLNDNNTLIVRYSFTQSDINGAGIGTFDLPLARLRLRVFKPDRAGHRNRRARQQHQ